MTAQSPLASISGAVDWARDAALKLKGQGNLSQLEEFRNDLWRKGQQGDKASLEAHRATFLDTPSSTPQSNTQADGLSSKIDDAADDKNYAAQVRAYRDLPGLRQPLIAQKLDTMDGVSRINTNYAQNIADINTTQVERLRNGQFGQSVELVKLTQDGEQRSRDMATQIALEALGNQRTLGEQSLRAAADLQKPTTLDYLGLVPNLLAGIGMLLS